MSAPTGRFNVTIETIGEQGSPLHWIVQTVTMLRSDFFVSLIKRLSSRIKKYELKRTADLILSLPLVVYSMVLGVMSVFANSNGLHNRVDETAFFDDVLNELGERLSLICFACCFAGDDACVKVYGNCVALFDILCRLVTFKNRKTDVD